MKKTILQEAQELTDGPRNADYGDVIKSFVTTSQIANQLGCDISAVGVCKVHIATKLSRESNKHKRDNLVDICGYVRLLSILEGDE